MVLVGDGGVGKTSFVERHRTGLFDTRYVASIGVNVHQLAFETTRGPIIFNVWDVPGQSSNLPGGFFACAQAGIIMFDVAARLSYSHVRFYDHDLKESRPDKKLPMYPIVLFRNKVDLEERKVKKSQVTYHKKKSYMHYFDISCKSDFNLDVPFLWLARKLSGDSKLHFAEAPALEPRQESKENEDN